MASVATMHFSYAQVKSLALQLPEAERIPLRRELAFADRADSFKRVSEMVALCEVTDEEIREECESVRQEMYEARLAGR